MLKRCLRKFYIEARCHWPHRVGPERSEAPRPTSLSEAKVREARAAAIRSRTEDEADGSLSQSRNTTKA